MYPGLGTHPFAHCLPGAPTPPDPRPGPRKLALSSSPASSQSLPLLRSASQVPLASGTFIPSSARNFPPQAPTGSSFAFLGVWSTCHLIQKASPDPTPSLIFLVLLTTNFKSVFTARLSLGEGGSLRAGFCPPRHPRGLEQLPLQSERMNESSFFSPAWEKATLRKPCSMSANTPPWSQP